MRLSDVLRALLLLLLGHLASLSRGTWRLDEELARSGSAQSFHTEQSVDRATLQEGHECTHSLTTGCRRIQSGVSLKSLLPQHCV